jgi:hypothetical protein
MRIIDLALDERINGYCATAVCSYEWYLTATTDAEANLTIQRNIIKDSKAYRTLRADLLRGCILPPLVLAISAINLPDELVARSATMQAELINTTQQNDGNSDPIPLVENTAPEVAEGGERAERQEDVSAESLGLARAQQDLTRILDALQVQLAQPRPSDTYIIDGLQRTNALRQTREELAGKQRELAEFLARPLRIEIWLNIPFGAIAYRMLLLNAGQKPMSIKRQVEVLSMKLKEDLSGIPGLEILMSLSSQRRTRAGQFVLGNLSQSFQAWLQGTPNIDVRNTVMEQLLAESAIDTLGTSLSGAAVHDDFKSFVQWLVELDRYAWTTDTRFFANETVLLGVSAAVGAAQRNDNLRDRMKRSLELLRVQASRNGPDVLAIKRFNELRQGEDVRKVNVGVFTRDMVYRAFQEFFISDGTKSMEDCWAFGAAQT